MFSAEAIATAFIAMFAAIAAVSFGQKRDWTTVEKCAAAIGLASSAYCLAAGLFILNGWHDPLASANSQNIVHAAATHGGRGGLVIFAIRFWPYVLIGLSGFFGFGYLLIFKQSFRSHAQR